MSTKPVIIIGGGGHAGVCCDLLNLIGSHVIGYTDKMQLATGLALKYLGNDDAIQSFSPNEVMLVNGIGFMPGSDLRERIFNEFKQKGYDFLTCIHPSVVASSSVSIAEGAQIFAGAILQANVSVGRNVILNSGVIIEHDCVVSDHVHLAPGVTVCGNVRIGRSTFVGCGAAVIQSVVIPDHSVVPAASCIRKSFASEKRVHNVQ